MTWKQKLKALGPCPEAYKWACQYTTFRQAWRACEMYEWMYWLLCNANEDSVAEALTVAVLWGFDPDAPAHEDSLCDAYCVLDFMPDPPVLP